MKEAELFDPMIDYLRSEGYDIVSVKRGREHGPDILASKKATKLYVELKGNSTALDVDFGTLLYQIMRWMKPDGFEDYAIGISESYLEHAKRCLYATNKLGIIVFVISKSGVKVLS